VIFLDSVINLARNGSNVFQYFVRFGGARENRWRSARAIVGQTLEAADVSGNPVSSVTRRTMYRFHPIRVRQSRKSLGPSLSLRHQPHCANGLDGSRDLPWNYGDRTAEVGSQKDFKILFNFGCARLCWSIYESARRLRAQLIFLDIAGCQCYLSWH
jgi:hypothetical protein